MPRRFAAALLSMLLVAGAAAPAASGHAGLVRADPSPGASLAAAPTSVQLTFSERPEPSLSQIRVISSGGAAYQVGEGRPSAQGQLGLSVPLRRLPGGTYDVIWRVVSAADGHATSGTFAFGVGGPPKGGAALTTTTTRGNSWLEGVARWLYLVGVVALLGAAVASVARFGGLGRSDLALAAGGWALSLVGLGLLAEAQREAAGSSFATLLDTSVGRALVWRSLALLLAGLALLVAWRRPAVRRPAMFAAGLGALAAIIVHVGAGHAAAGPWPGAITVSAQVAHFAAAGVWFGGLAALLLGLRGKAPAAKQESMRRFAVLALLALLIVVGTGALRTIDELSSIGQLISSGYGRAILAKVVLVAVIVGIAARSRRSINASTEDLRPFRRRSSAELLLALAALALAALLGTVAPPTAGQAGTTGSGLAASGSDYGTTIRARLTAASARPGPNRFRLRIEDYDTGQPVIARLVSLRFTPLDDPDVDPSSLALRRVADGLYAGAGAEMGFDGRWAVTALIDRGAETIQVPFELDLPGPKYFVSVERIPQRPPKYTMQIGSIGYIRVEPDPERAGPSRIYVTCYTAFQSVSRVEQMIVTAAAGDGPTEQQPLRRLGPGRFVADVDLVRGPMAITVIARTRDGTRLRGLFHLDIPG